MVIEWAKNLDGHVKCRDKGLLLSGPVGVGKSWALAALTAKFALEVSDDYEYVTAPDMFERAIEFSHDMDHYRDQAWKQTYSSVRWLVINDLGKEYRGGKLSEQTAYIFGRIIRTRSERKLTTHITCNLQPTEIHKVYGESIASLLAEMTTPYVIRGEDRRKIR